jgi:hypothetical protein
LNDKRVLTDGERAKKKNKRRRNPPLGFLKGGIPLDYKQQQQQQQRNQKSVSFINPRKIQ